MYKQGDILLVPIPFTDLTSSKKRPVLVISNSNYNKQTEDIIAVAITSNITSKDYTVLLNSTNLREGTLKLESCIRTDKIYTPSQRIVVRKFVSVRDSIIKAVKKEIDKPLMSNICS